MDKDKDKAGVFLQPDGSWGGEKTAARLSWAEATEAANKAEPGVGWWAFVGEKNRQRLFTVQRSCGEGAEGAAEQAGLRQEAWRLAAEAQEQWRLGAEHRAKGNAEAGEEADSKAQELWEQVERLNERTYAQLR